MAAIRGRRPLVGVLTGGSGGTYIAPTLRNSRGRVFPGVLLAFGGSSRAEAIRQIMPVFTQALAGGPVTVTGTLAQQLHGFTQSITGVYTPSTARSVRVTYLVLEVPDPITINTGQILQVTPKFSQAVEGFYDPNARQGAIFQLTPKFTQSGELSIEVTSFGVINQATPKFTQALQATFVPGEIILGDPYLFLPSPDESGIGSSTLTDQLIPEEN